LLQYDKEGLCLMINTRKVVLAAALCTRHVQQQVEKSRAPLAHSAQAVFP
jgi:predicted acyltransferase